MITLTESGPLTHRGVRFDKLFGFLGRVTGREPRRQESDSANSWRQQSGRLTRVRAQHTIICRLALPGLSEMSVCLFMIASPYFPGSKMATVIAFFRAYKRILVPRWSLLMPPSCSYTPTSRGASLTCLSLPSW